jgi:hypothetical protein
MGESSRSIWSEISSKTRPMLVALAVDLTGAASLWISIAAAHFMQMHVLSFGWSKALVEALDVVEEYTVFASVIVFLLVSVFTFVWAIFRRTAGELE